MGYYIIIRKKDKINDSIVSCIVDGESEIGVNEIIEEGGKTYHVIVAGYIPRIGKTAKEKAQTLLSKYIDGTIDGNKLYGSYSLVIINQTDGDIMVVTDSFASRVVWKYEDSETIEYASDVRYLVRERKEKLTIDQATLYSFLVYQRAIGNHSMWNEIKSVMPGTIERYSKGGLNVEKYYKTQFTHSKKNVNKAAKEFVQLLKEVVSDICADVAEPALMMGGGLDSRLVAAVSPKNVTCVTLADYKNLEAKSAGKVAQKANLKWHFVERPSNLLADNFKEATATSDAIHPWTNAHFLNINKITNFKYDAAMTALLVDTFYKGLWISITYDYDDVGSYGANIEGMEKIILDLTPKKTDIDLFLDSQEIDKMYQYYKDAVREHCRYVLKFGDNIHDLVQLFWTSSINTGVAEFQNASSLRTVTSERTPFFDIRLNNFMRTMDPEIRKDSDFIKKCIKIADWRLWIMPTSNTMLPVAAPSWVIIVVEHIRPKLGHLKMKLFPKKVKTSSSWPSVSSLIKNNEKLKDELLSLKQMADVLGFDKSKVEKYIDTCVNTGTRTLTFDSLVTFFSFMKQLD